MTSAAWPIDVAVATTLRADSGLTALLSGDRVYSLAAPPSAVPDYVVLADTSEGDAREFAKAGKQGITRLHIWSMKPGKSGVLAIYDAIDRLLNRVRLTVTGFVQVVGAIRLITVLQDPDVNYRHGVVEYAWLVVAA